MSNVPENLRYTADHEWAREEGDGTIAVGITEYAQDALGDITYVELPTVGDAFAEKDAFGVVESVKTFSDLYAPVAGEVVAANEALLDEPETINTAPYGDGWLVKIKPEDGDAFAGLMDAAAYAKHLEEAG